MFTVDKTGLQLTSVYQWKWVDNGFGSSPNIQNSRLECPLKLYASYFSVQPLRGNPLSGTRYVASEFRNFRIPRLMAPPCCLLIEEWRRAGRHTEVSTIPCVSFLLVYLLKMTCRMLGYNFAWFARSFIGRIPLATQLKARVWPVWGRSASCW